MAACGSSSKSSSSSSTAAAASPTSAAGSPTTAGGSSSGGIEVSTASVAGLGTVLVNGAGDTLYILTSEKGGKVTCTDDTGCTKVWPDSELPKGTTAATAGMGIQQALLGTTKNSDGDLYVTYAGYPLYTFAHDTAPGQANGEGIKSFGGTWEVMAPDGTPVAPGATAGAGSTGTGAGASSSSSSSSGAYGY
jgi:predicted lipoprotein with Yx(FWY)xxD motif